MMRMIQVCWHCSVVPIHHRSCKYNNNNNNNNNMSSFVSRFIYCDSTSKRQTSIIFGPDPKGPCGQSELLRLVTGRN